MNLVRRPRLAEIVLLAVCSVGTAQASQLPIVLQLENTGTHAERPAARVVLSSLATAGVKESEARETAVPGKLVFEVADRSIWQLTVNAKGYWSESRVVGPAPLASPTVVELVAAGTLAGEVRPPQGEKDPKEVEVRFRSAPGVKKPRPELSVRCPVSERRFRCEVPAGDLDLRFRARGFLTRYRWAARVPARGIYKVGTIDLQRGSSVVGWIDPPRRDFRFGDCKVEIVPIAAGLAPSLDDLSRRGVLRQQARVSDRGFFVFDALAPGSYTLTARHPGFAETTMTPILVQAGAETEIKSVALQPPARLEVHLDPARDPYQRRWTVDLERRGLSSQSYSSAGESNASEEGVWRSGELAAGAYLVRVLGSYNSIWKSEELTVSPGMSPYELHLPFVQVEGEITLGREPLLALLWFGGFHGIQRVAAKSDAKGRFEIVLPEHADSWRVEVINDRLHVAGLVGVEVRQLPGESKARVSIELPDTAARGEVADEDGHPVADASVDGFGGKHSEHVTATSEKGEGRFEFRGLSAGEWNFEARRSDGENGLESDVFVGSVREGSPLDPIHLVLHKKIKISGLVVSPEGQGVPNARLIGRFDDARVSAILPETTADVNGVFELRLPAAAEGVQLTVLAPGFAVRVLRIDARSREPLVIPVSPVGGTLELAIDAHTPMEALEKLAGVWLFNEVSVGYIDALRSWAELNGVEATDPARLTIPMLEPGRYTVCSDVGPFVYLTGRLSPGLDDHCASGDLDPFGQLSLRVPPSKQK